MSGPSFYEAGTVARVAVNLFYGWGYNFYRAENQLRADDLMIRAKASELLAAARHSIETAEAAFRRECLPPPSRERPRPDPAALRDAQILEALGREIGSLEGHIRALPIPEQDRMTQRLRREDSTLALLSDADQTMVGHTEMLRALLAPASATWMVENAAEIHAHLAAIEAAVQARRDLLAG